MTNADWVKLARRCAAWGEDYEVCDRCPFRQDKYCVNRLLSAMADALEREEQNDEH